MLAGCGSDDPDSAASSASTADPTPEFSALLGSFDHISGHDQRIMLGLVDAKNKVISDTEVVHIKFGSSPSALDGPRLKMVGHAPNVDLGSNPYFTVAYRFPDNPAGYTIPNSWFAQVHWKDTVANLAIPVADPAKVKFPVPGAPMRSMKTPTTTDPMDTSPLCTRADEACPFHSTSLDDELKSSGPIVLLFATPARCQSQFCGPELENVIEVSKEFPRIRFIHHEIYQSSTSDDYQPGVLQYGMSAEPIIFIADTNHTIREYVTGSIEAGELREILKTL